MGPCLGTANLVLQGIMTNPAELRGCRGGCGKMETTCHIVQACHITHISGLHGPIISPLSWLLIIEPRDER